MATSIGVGPQTKCEVCGTPVALAWQPDVTDPDFRWWTEWPEGFGFPPLEPAEFVEHTPER